jgi:Dna[CI] antecedent, DciA
MQTTYMRKKNDQLLGDVLAEFITENRLKSPLNESRIRGLWEQLMGKTIATYTSEIVVRKGTLYLTIISAPLRQELAFGKDKIRSVLNEHLGEDFVKEVVIR